MSDVAKRLLQAATRSSLLPPPPAPFMAEVHSLLPAVQYAHTRECRRMQQGTRRRRQRQISRARTAAAEVYPPHQPRRRHLHHSTRRRCPIQRRLCSPRRPCHWRSTVTGAISIINESKARQSTTRRRPRRCPRLMVGRTHTTRGTCIHLQAHGRATFPLHAYHRSSIMCPPTVWRSCRQCPHQCRTAVPTWCMEHRHTWRGRHAIGRDAQSCRQGTRPVGGSSELCFMSLLLCRGPGSQVLVTDCGTPPT